VDPGASPGTIREQAQRPQKRGAEHQGGNPPRDAVPNGLPPFADVKFFPTLEQSPQGCRFLIFLPAPNPAGSNSAPGERPPPRLPACASGGRCYVKNPIGDVDAACFESPGIQNQRFKASQGSRGKNRTRGNRTKKWGVRGGGNRAGGGVCL